ncbi:LutC/YkgG family protein [Ferruginibacter sp. SUN106]|uniref:LutC/YkgG family protein n=1 Tax=Ferruginibacter sp. SUN106 TaxID=2978348 RepID=UPI003D365C6C
MSSREKILAAVKTNQPALQQLPVLEQLNAIRYEDNFLQFKTVLTTIGGKVVEIKSTDEIIEYVKNNFSNHQNYVTTLPELKEIKMLDEHLDPHFLENIEVAVVKALFGVAENGSVWLTDDEIKIRALPFICQHLAVLLNKKDMVSNMHEAYQLIGNNNYDFGVFIAGPSKTADIEQSLVLGAHGPKTMTVFIIS